MLCSRCATPARAWPRTTASACSTASIAALPRRAATAHGSGLGLAIVKRIAERHHAQIDLGAGIDGRGLGVTVRLPLAGSA